MSAYLRDSKVRNLELLHLEAKAENLHSRKLDGWSLVSINQLRIKVTSTGVYVQSIWTPATNMKPVAMNRAPTSNNWQHIALKGKLHNMTLKNLYGCRHKIRMHLEHISNQAFMCFRRYLYIRRLPGPCPGLLSVCCPFYPGVYMI